MSLEKKPWIKQFLGRTNNSDVYWKNKAFKLNYNAEPTFESQASKHKVWPEKRVRFYQKKKKKKVWNGKIVKKLFWWQTS